MSDYLREIPWETRNLRVRSFALADDFITDPDEILLKQQLTRRSEEFGQIFVQARIAKADMRVAPALERAGFYFVETALVPHTVIKKNEVFSRFLADRSTFIPSRYRTDSVETVRMSKGVQDLDVTVREIAGESFTDDRFHLDTNCSKQIADERYALWCDDLLHDERVRFTLLSVAGKTVAFMACKDNNLLLAGFSRQYVNSGLGDFFWLSVLEEIQGEGHPQAHSMISANNTAVLNLYARIGFKFKDPSATFHYWSDFCGKGATGSNIG